MTDYKIEMTLENEGLAPPAVEDLVETAFPHADDISVEEKP